MFLVFMFSCRQHVFVMFNPFCKTLAASELSIYDQQHVIVLICKIPNETSMPQIKLLQVVQDIFPSPPKVLLIPSAQSIFDIEYVSMPPLHT